MGFVFFRYLLVFQFSGTYLKNPAARRGLYRIPTYLRGFSICFSFSRSFVFAPFFAPGCGLTFATRHPRYSPHFPAQSPSHRLLRIQIPIAPAHLISLHPFFLHCLTMTTGHKHPARRLYPPGGPGTDGEALQNPEDCRRRPQGIIGGGGPRLAGLGSRWL